MQPYDLSSLKIMLVIGLSFGVTFLLPTIESGILAMVVKTSVITVTYVGLTYVMKIVPEFHKYLPFQKED